MGLTLYLQGLWASIIGMDGGRETMGFKAGVSAVLALVWSSVSPQFAGLMSSPVVVWVSVFWALDWVIGSLLAWREHRYDPRRGLFSCVKWLIWMAVVVVCWGLRHDGSPLDDWIPPLLEVTILLTEAASVVRNAAALMASISGRKEAGVLLRFARAMERSAQAVDDTLHRKLDEIESRREAPEEGSCPASEGGHA